MGHAESESDAGICIEIAYSPKCGDMVLIELVVAPTATVEHALLVSGVLESHAEIRNDALQIGIWGTRCHLASLLRHKDRIEIYRPLIVDPKESRRLRDKSDRPQKNVVS